MQVHVVQKQSLLLIYAASHWLEHLQNTPNVKPSWTSGVLLPIEQAQSGMGKQSKSLTCQKVDWSKVHLLTRLNVITAASPVLTH